MKNNIANAFLGQKAAQNMKNQFVAEKAEQKKVSQLAAVLMSNTVCWSA